MGDREGGKEGGRVKEKEKQRKITLFDYYNQSFSPEKNRKLVVLTSVDLRLQQLCLSIHLL